MWSVRDRKIKALTWVFSPSNWVNGGLFAQTENAEEGKACRRREAGSRATVLHWGAFETPSRQPSGAVEWEVSSVDSEVRGEVWAGDIHLSIKIHGNV